MKKEAYSPITTMKTIHQIPLMDPWMRRFRYIMSFNPHLKKKKTKIYEVGTSSSLVILMGAIRQWSPLTQVTFTKPSIVTGNVPSVL